jgi:hypothetical protein
MTKILPNYAMQRPNGNLYRVYTAGYDGAVTDMGLQADRGSETAFCRYKNRCCLFQRPEKSQRNSLSDIYPKEAAAQAVKEASRG